MFQAFVAITTLSVSQLTFLCFMNFLHCAKQNTVKHTSDISNQYSLESASSFWYYNHYYNMLLIY